MGTNYYVQYNICTECGRHDELHIGKASKGWAFALHQVPEMGLNSLKDWNTFLASDGKHIANEYNQKIDREEMYNLIMTMRPCTRRHPFDYTCDSRGETYDLIKGDFS